MSRAAIDAVLAGLEFTAPVELADIYAVRDRITLRLAPDEKLEIYHRHRDVVIEIRENNLVTYRRILEVT